MNEEKRFGGGSGDANRSGKETGNDQQRNNAASRARNRTVMLTPEMTGQVRALLYQDPEEEAASSAAASTPRRDPLTELLPPMDWSRSEGANNATPAGEEYSRDLAATEADRSDRSGSTGKIDTDIVHEAKTAAPEPARRAAPPAPQASFSVNPNAARQAAPAAPRRAADSRPRPQAAPTSRVVGFLVTYDKNKHGEVYEVRAGRWLVTSRPTDHGEYILIDDETVSPLHAIVRATKEGKVQVLDQLSEFGTGVKKQGQEEEQEVSGTMVNIDHGDVLRLGERRFVVALIPQVKTTESDEE